MAGAEQDRSKQVLITGVKTKGELSADSNRQTGTMVLSLDDAYVCS